MVVNFSFARSSVANATCVGGTQTGGARYQADSASGARSDRYERARRKVLFEKTIEARGCGAPAHQCRNDLDVKDGGDDNLVAASE